MKLISVFFRRRLWILAHHWLTELALSLLLPVGIYLSIVVGLENLIRLPLNGVPFSEWILPGLIFVVVLITSYFPTFSDLFENRRLHPFYESIVASPNSPASIVSALTVALIPEVIIRSVLAAVIFQLLSRSMLPILPLLGFLVFLVILSFLIINLAITLTLITRSSVLHLVGIFIISLLIMFSSGWIIPLEYFPLSLQKVLSALPTALLLEGGRQLLFHSKITLLTWFIPLVISLIWLMFNAVIFTRVSTR